MVDIDQIFLLKRKESEGTNNVLAVTKPLSKLRNLLRMDRIKINDKESVIECQYVYL